MACRRVHVTQHVAQWIRKTANKGIYAPGFPPTKAFLLVADKPPATWTRTAATRNNKHGSDPDASINWLVVNFPREYFANHDGGLEPEPRVSGFG